MYATILKLISDKEQLIVLISSYHVTIILKKLINIQKPD